MTALSAVACRRRLASAYYVFFLAVLYGCDRAPQSQQQSSQSKNLTAGYVGGAKCIGCHAVEAELWRRSHHALAMQEATPKSVLANFDDGKFTKDGIETKFFRRDGQYYVRTDGSDGRLTDFRVAYTFGVEPLQQYLLELPHGRLQASSIAWDTRTKEQGGQRWFHLYPHEKIDHRDVLHWTGPAQNNHMCAECHSTNLQKNHRPEQEHFETRGLVV